MIRRWWVLVGLLVVLGLGTAYSIQAQETALQIVGTLYYQRDIGQDREYIRLISDGATIILQDTFASFNYEYFDYSLPAPPLPDLMRNLFLYPNGFYLKSPTLPIYVYLRCPESQITYFYSESYREKIEFCQEQHLVVFDAETSEAIRQLDVDQVPPHNGLADIYTFVWSPSGRYLAYSTATCAGLAGETCPHIRIYDVIAREYIDTSATAHDGAFVFAALDHALQWSPNERYFAFLQNPNVASKSSEYITVLDTITNSIATSIPFDFAGGDMNWLWSPDSQSIAYVKAEGQLVRINVGDGSSELLDTNVTRIIAWTE